MPPTRDAITQNLAERVWWEVARRDETRLARRLDQKQVVDGVSRLDEGAWLDDFFHVLRALGVMDLLAEVQGTAIQREMGPLVQSILLYGVKTLFGIERINSLPALLLSDAALMPRVGCKAPPVRRGVCRRGTATRQGERAPGPMCPETLAKNIVQLNVRDLEAVFNGVIRALAKAGVFAKRGTGMAAGPDLETTRRSAGGGHVTRKVRIDEKNGRRHEIEVTVYGWQGLVLIDAATTMPLAVKMGTIEAHASHWTRALVTQARANLAGAARLHKVVFDQGLVDGTDLGWLHEHDLACVGPAKANMAVTADTRAQAVAEEGSTVGRRGHTVRHGHGRAAWTARRETEVVGITGLTTDAQYGPPEHGRHHHRRDFEPNVIKAVVVRQWQGKDDGPGGKTVCLTNASVHQPLQPFDDDDGRRLIENCCIKAAKQPWELGHPPQKNARAVRVHVVFTRRLFALATAYRPPGEQAATRGEPVGWPRWRRQLCAQTRNLVIVCAQGAYGIFHLAAFALLLGVNSKDGPPGIGTRQEILANYGLTPKACILCWNLSFKVPEIPT